MLPLLGFSCVYFISWRIVLASNIISLFSNASIYAAAAAAVQAADGMAVVVDQAVSKCK
jgi:hypothetical protein